VGFSEDGSDIQGIDVTPVAVDTHVQRATEVLGLVKTRELDDRHRRAIQDV
jgi:endonuclease III